MLIQQFNFNIVHRPGTTKGNADGLSRRPYGRFSLNALDSAGLRSQRIFEFQRKDPDIAEIIDYLEDDRLSSDQARARRLLLNEDVYFLDEHNLLYHLDTTENRSRKGSHPHSVMKY